MRITPANALRLAGVAAAAFAAVYVYRKGVVGAAAAIAEGATYAATSAAKGVVLGIGKSVGLPETNETACARALAEGRTWDASMLCPAGTFVKSWFGSTPATPALNGVECACSGKPSPEAWIAAAGLAFALYAHVSNKRRHRARK